MSTGQILLTLASFVLLAYITMNINHMYIQFVDQSVDSQLTSDAINFGRDLSEELQSYAFKYALLEDDFGSKDDVEDPNKRIAYAPQVGQAFYATVDLTSEMVLELGESGRKATIHVYELVNQEYVEKAEFVTTISNLN